MRADDFVSIPEELISSAIAYAEKFDTDGYKVEIEPFDVAFPRTPTFIAQRGMDTTIFEVHSSLRAGEAREWVRFAKSRSTETRFAVGLAPSDSTPSDVIDVMREMGAGLHTIGKGGPGEIVPSTDLALNLELPDIPLKLRQLLGEGYNQFAKGQWREGFESCCQVFEQEARAYLKRKVQRNPNFTVPTGRASPATTTQVDKFTMGQLAKAFEGIQSPNAADSRIATALDRINNERVTVAHYKGRGAVRERQLRQKVAGHMFVLMGGLRAIKGISN